MPEGNVSEREESQPVPATRPVKPAKRRFLWSYKHKLDGQNRVAFPASWRPSEPDITFMLVLWPHRHAGSKFGFIKGLTEESFADLQDQLDAMSPGDADAEGLKRSIFKYSHPAKLDPAGRIWLPEEMKDAVGITKEVEFIGTGGDFQIWDPAISRKCEDAETTQTTSSYSTLLKK
jgi:MraZ protein